MRSANRLRFAFALMLFLVSCGCGGSSGSSNGPTVDSITITPASVSASQASFTASGQVGSMTVNPLTVGWLEGPFFFELPGVQLIGWTPTTQPFVPENQCASQPPGTTFAVAAYRPVDLNAPSTATMTVHEAEDLFGGLNISNTSTNAGWIASSATITCP